MGEAGHALVTGASSGIGLAYARALRRRGTKIVLVARREDRLRKLAEELGGGESAVVLPADLTASSGVAELVQAVRERGLRIELLVNNAGMGHTDRFAEQRPEVIEEMLDLNIKALVHLTRAFLPDMLARGGGSIVNVASNAAFQPVPFLTVYAATKAFVLSFTEGVAEEVRGSGVRVQALCPGITATEFLDVAETHSGLLVRRMPLMTAEQVVEASLAGLDRGRVRVIAGFANRALATVQRFVPNVIVRRVSAELYRPRGVAAS
jgi:short-subunit dehydrogenase